MSVSSMSVGMNLSAMLIIMLISCTGIFIFLSGPIMISSPSVSAMGLVVYVSMNVPTIRRMMRSDIITARSMPSQVMIQPSTIGVPSV